MGWRLPVLIGSEDLVKSSLLSDDKAITAIDSFTVLYLPCAACLT